jgi:hypothetical protein
MMGSIQYIQDYSGTLADNEIPYERHVIKTGGNRAVFPRYAPFFSDGMVVYDIIRGVTLVRGADYVLIDLAQEATLRAGVELHCMIVITNPAVSVEVTLAYRTVGGALSMVASNITKMYEDMMSDQKKVDWLTEVTNKQEKYPPSSHSHHLSQVFGFEEVIYAIERLRTAVSSREIDILSILKSWVENRLKFLEFATYADIDLEQDSSKIVTVDTLFYALDHYHGNQNWAGVFTPTYQHMESESSPQVATTITTLNVPDGQTLYWQLELEKTGNPAVTAFAKQKGSALLTVGVAKLTFRVLPAYVRKDFTFRLVIRRRSPIGMVIYRSRWTKYSEITDFRVSCMEEDWMNRYGTGAFFNHTAEAFSRVID